MEEGLGRSLKRHSFERGVIVARRGFRERRFRGERVPLNRLIQLRSK